MTGDDQIPEPGPVAEYRDPELVRRFQSDPVPQHGAGFWSELEARLGGASGSDTPDVTAPLPVTSVDLAPVRTDEGRWTAGRWLVAAAVAVLGLGGAFLVAQGRSSSPVESAAPSPDSGQDDADDETAPPMTSTTLARTTTTAAPPSTSTVPQPPVAPGPDYFADGVRVDPIGPGRVVAFSPDDAAVLILDDAPGVASGCEGAELLALFTQDLNTGRRRSTLGEGVAIETGGLELAISPFGATPDEVATRPVYGKEWCDGEPSALWRGVLAADGQVSMIEPVEMAGADDPFAAGQTGLYDGSGLTSPDGEHVVVISGSTAQVAERGAEGGAVGPVVASLPDDLGLRSISGGSWSPAGDVVALSAEGALVLWSPWTGEHQRFDSQAASGLVFDNSGGRLAVVSWDGDTTSSLLTFGDRPEPVPAPPRCSGRVAMPALSTQSLIEQGLPPQVITTAIAIDDAAATCDWSTLEGLTPEEFVAGFGGGDALEIWRQQEANGQSPMWYLRTLLRQPNVVDTTLEPVLHVWPSLYLKEDCSYGPADKEILDALGYGSTLGEEACELVGGYLGHRTAIDASGQWRYFVAGD